LSEFIKDSFDPSFEFAFLAAVDSTGNGLDERAFLARKLDAEDDRFWKSGLLSL
jgi:hypothetical protein